MIIFCIINITISLNSLLCWPVLVPQITGGLVVPGLDTVNVSAIKVEIVLPISVLKVENE